MAQPALDRGLGAHDATDGSILSRYLLDTTVLIAHLRGDRAVTDALLQRLGVGHSLGTTCVNIAEIERGLRPAERKKAQVLLDRLVFFDTTREAAIRAGRYQADPARRGRTIHTPDALIAGTARAHGAVLVTDNLDDFPMRDIRVESLAAH
jgi:predicted nucleic acid-binding protein